MSKKPVGLIGLGLLGSALAERLSGQFQVVGFDMDPQRRTENQRRGVRVVECAAEVARECQRIVLCLPNSQDVVSCVAELQNELSSGTVIIDTTTGDPATTVELAAQLRTRNVKLIDATFLGSSTQARSGEVTLMIGGDADAVANCNDIFAALSDKRFHLGPTGNGQRMKLVANLVLGLNRAVLAEGLHFAAACGLDLPQVLGVLQSGAAYSRVMDDKGAKMLSGDFTPQARLSQHLKDVCLILEQTEHGGASLPLSQLHAELLERAERAGWGDADNCAIIQAYAGEAPS